MNPKPARQQLLRTHLVTAISFRGHHLDCSCGATVRAADGGDQGDLSLAERTAAACSDGHRWWPRWPCVAGAALARPLEEPEQDLSGTRSGDGRSAGRLVVTLRRVVIPRNLAPGDDIDKLARACLDSLTSVLFADDSQVGRVR